MKKLFTLTAIVFTTACSNITAPEFESSLNKVMEVDSKPIYPNKDSTQCYKVISIVDSLPLYPANSFTKCWKMLPVTEIDSIAFFNARNGRTK